MENLSLQYNANEQSVKASDVSVLFDENPILKFQVCLRSLRLFLSLSA